jgi:predicted transcriptional regulator
VANGNFRREFPSSVDLNETKQYLLDIAKNILLKQKGSQLYPLDLFTIAKTEQRYPESELFQSVSELYDEKWIVPGETITKDKVLEGSDCSNIYDFVKRNPGCDTLDIMNGLKISFRRALKNLEILFKFGFIRARVFSQYYLYYQVDSPEELDVVYRLSRNKTVIKILKFMLEKKTPCTILEVAGAINKPSETIQQKFNRLVQEGVLSQVPNESTKYQLNITKKETRQEILSHLKTK